MDPFDVIADYLCDHEDGMKHPTTRRLNQVMLQEATPAGRCRLVWANRYSKTSSGRLQGSSSQDPTRQVDPPKTPVS